MKAQNADVRKVLRSASETAPSSPTALVLCVDDDISQIKLSGELMTMNGYAVHPADVVRVAGCGA